MKTILAAIALALLMLTFCLQSVSRIIAQSVEPGMWLPIVMNCSPAIALTYVPPYGSGDDLQGSVPDCVEPAIHKVAVYIYVSGWWTKPTFANPLTSINTERSWTTDITTGGNDHQATKIMALLLPNGCNPPEMSGEQQSPDQLFACWSDKAMVERTPSVRTLQFSGYTWNVKASSAPVGPGPNYFSEETSDVWVDENGWLHLRIAFRDNQWYATEVISIQSFGYGTYTYTLASHVDQLDKNVVLGLFTYEDAAPEHNYREIDIEFSRWGEVTELNAQYVVQPWTNAGNRHRFALDLPADDSTHSFRWSSEQIQFSSYQNSPPDAGSQVESWLYTGNDLPSAGAESAHINLWLLNGSPPSDNQEVEVIIESFEYAS